MVDNCRSGDGEVEGLTDEYTELEILSMVNVGLSSLSKLPSLPKLRKVSLTSCFPACSGASSPFLPPADWCVFTCVSAGGQ